MSAAPAVAAPAVAARSGGPSHRRGSDAARLRVLAIGIAAVVLVAGVVLSVFVGSGDIPADRVIEALSGGSNATDELLIRQYRLPRTVLAVLVGIALGLAGVVMQALTRNPLADPGLLGVNAGAYFAVVMGSAFFSAAGSGGQMLWGIVGAGITALAVYGIANTGTAAGTVVKLVLSGVAIGAVLSGFSQAVTLTNPEVFDRIRFWSVGSLQGRQWDTVHAIWVVIVAGAVIVLLLSRSLNALTMGEEVARSLGTNIPLVRGIAFAVITALCGAATAGVGPLVFVGLVVPFIARFVVGVDHRWIVAFALVAGPALVLLADVLGRLLSSSELPAGVVTAFVGAPVMIVLVRRSRLRSL